MTPELFDLPTMEAALDGLAIGLGLTLFIAALVGFVKREPDPESFAVSFERAFRGSVQRLAISGLVGILVALLTGWPVAGIAVCALIFFWGKLFGGVAGERLAMQRVEALAMWTESLRDTIAGAVGLEQAIPASARAASPVLRPHLNTLIDRLRARMPLPDALQYLADDIDDASADLVISALMLNAKLRGPGLRDVLGSLAKSAREEVDMRQRVMAQRAGTRRSVQIIVIVVCVVVLGVAFLAGGFVKPYDTLAGQMVLCMVIALFGAGFWWMRRLAEVEAPPRLLVKRSPGEQRAAEGMVPSPQAMSPWSMPPSRASAPFTSDATSTASSASSSVGSPTASAGAAAAGSSRSSAGSSMSPPGSSMSSAGSSSGSSSVVPPNGAPLRGRPNSLFTPSPSSTRSTSGSLFPPSPLSTPPVSPPSTPPLSGPPLSGSPLSGSPQSTSQASTPPPMRLPFAAPPPQPRPPQPRPPEPIPPNPLPPQTPAQSARSSSSLLPQWKSPPPTPPLAPSVLPATTSALPMPPVPAPLAIDSTPTVSLPRIRDVQALSGPPAPPPADRIERTDAAGPTDVTDRTDRTDVTVPTDATDQTDTIEPSEPSIHIDPADPLGMSNTSLTATQQSSTPDSSTEPPSNPPGDTP